jgi:glycosyltransferase involved in cell wall biosynthesis
MRVTVLNPIGLVGGAERVLLAGIRAVYSEFPQAQVQLVLLKDGPLREAATQLGAAVEVVQMPDQLAQMGETQYRSGGKLAAIPELLKSTPQLLITVNRLRSVIRKFRPNLLHSHGVKAHLLTRAIAPARTPVIGTIHDFLGERPLAGKLLRRLGGLTHAVAISEAVKRDLAVVCPGLPCYKVHNPVDTELFTPETGDGTQLDRDSGLSVAPAGTLRCGLVATYANWKGHRLFLESLAKVKQLPLRGYIIGGPIYSTPGSQVSREELVQLVEQLGLTGMVGFLPFQANPLAVYRALDIVVHASIRPEPFGLTIVEAMSCGKPVIVSEAGGAVELFQDGVSALGFPMGDATQLAERLERLVKDAELRGRLGQAARTQALTFSQPHFAQGLAEVYRKVLGN